MTNKAAPALQETFNRACGFWNVQSALTDHLLRMTEEIVKLQADTRALCNVKESEDPLLTGKNCLSAQDSMLLSHRLWCSR